MRKVLNTDVFYDDIATQFIADAINSKAVPLVVAGGAVNAVVSLNGDTPKSIPVALKATGALLVHGTDYTEDPNGIKFLTDQTAGSIVVFYTL